MPLVIFVVFLLYFPLPIKYLFMEEQHSPSDNNATYASNQNVKCNLGIL